MRLLKDGLSHEHVDFAAKAAGGRVLHQHLSAALAVRGAQEVVAGLAVVLFCTSRDADRKLNITKAN